MSTEIEDTFKRLLTYKGLKGIIVFNNDGIPIRTTFERGPTLNYVSHYSQLVNRVRNALQESDPTNDVTFVRIRSKRDEVLISPEKDYVMLVVQNPCSD